MRDLALYNDQLDRTQPQTLKLLYKLTAAKTVIAIPAHSASLVAFDAIASQAVIDSFLGTTNEFLLAAFDATSMGADAMAVIVNMGGQARSVLNMVARCYSASNTLVERQDQVSTGLTASTLETKIAVGANGNIALKVDWGNSPDMDTLAAGTIEILIDWLPK